CRTGWNRTGDFRISGTYGGFVDPKDVDQFLAYSAEENLEAVAVAVVTEEPRLVLEWRGKEIVNLSRAFLDTNGAHQETTANVEIPDRQDEYFSKLNIGSSFHDTMLK